MTFNRKDIFTRNRVLGLLAVPFIVYGILTAGMYSFQRSLLYFPSHVYMSPREALADPAFQELNVKTADGIELKGWYAPATTKSETLVIFHGNANDLRTVAPMAAIYIRAGYGILIAEYRGYSGLPGFPTEGGLYADARAYMKKLLSIGLKERSLILFGHSLGTGIAAQMAVEFHVGGVILQSPYVSTTEVAKGRYWYLPVELLMKDRFETIKKIKAIAAPLLIGDGGEDDVIPPEEARELFAMANEPKQFYFSAVAGHTNIFAEGFDAATLKWLDRLNSGLLH